MNFCGFRKRSLCQAASALAAVLLITAAASADDNDHSDNDRGVLVLTSTNNSSGNDVVVFKLDTDGTPSLSLVNQVATGGKGGASTNAGILQFKDDLGAVANYGSNNVTQIERDHDFISIGKTVSLATGCTKPDSVALSEQNLFVVGANCAESHSWPSGKVDGGVVGLTDPSAAQIAAGKTWAAVTMSSGSLLQLPLSNDGALSGTSASVPLPSIADNTPLGEAFWGDILGFTPAHSPDSFAIVDPDRSVFPVVGPMPSYPTNAPCWVAKGPGNVWYAGNSPGEAVSIFFSDSQGGVFYKPIPLPGSPTDVSVSADGKWLAVIYSVASQGYVRVFSIDKYGDLTLAATSPSIGVAGFSGVAISE